MKLINQIGLSFLDLSYIKVIVFLCVISRKEPLSVINVGEN